jgi:hypothetical protein
MVDRQSGMTARWSRKLAVAALRCVLDLVAAGLLAALIFWATVMWLSSVILAFALTASWLTVVVIKLRGRTHQNAALVALSIVAMAGCLELALRGAATAGIVDHLPNRSPWDRGRVEVITPQIVAVDPQLGHRLVGPRRARATVTRNGVVIYDVFYTIGGDGFRVTPDGSAAGQPVLVMGDSYHFGDGLEDDQTLAFHLARRSAETLRPINLAVSGYGPHQVLRQLQLGIPSQSDSKPFAHLLLSVTDDHVWRAGGRLSWQRNSPRYELTDGRLRLDGTLQASSEFIAKLRLGSTQAALIERTLERDDAYDRRRFSAILREIRAEAQAKYGAELLVLYHMMHDLAGAPIADRLLMRDLICQAGVSYIDVGARLELAGQPFHRNYIPGDGHPTSHLNDWIARLAVDHIDGRAQPDRCED